MHNSAPISQDELAGLFAPLSDYGACVIAVSGGPDSTALMHLSARWKALLGGETPKLVVASVDHGLRAGSAQEAREVARQAALLGLPHVTLTWEGMKPSTGVQEAARGARYRMLVDLASQQGAVRSAVVVAHTREDQAETLLMRLARGSGLDGLAGMARVRRAADTPAVDIIRPLLGVAKARLLATLRAHDISWIEDPSNERTEFERVRLRKARRALSEVGLTSEPVALSAARLGRARAALEAATAQFISANVDPHAGAFASIDRQRLARAPEEIRLRALAAVIARFGGEARVPPLAALEALHVHLGEANSAGVTLGGTIVTSDEHEVRVFRESGRRGLPQVRVAPGERTCWDNRFIVGLGERAETAVDVRPLGIEAYATLRSDLPEAGLLPSRAAATLPSFWAGEMLVAVPHLSMGGGATGHGGSRAPTGNMSGAYCSAEFIW